MSLMLIVAKAFRNSYDAYTTNEVAEQLKIPGILLEPIKQRLVNAGLLEMGSRDQLLPARDPDTINLMEVIDAVRSAHDADIYRGGDWPRRIDSLFDQIDRDVRTDLQGRSLYDLLDDEVTQPV